MIPLRSALPAMAVPKIEDDQEGKFDVVVLEEQEPLLSPVCYNLAG